MRQKLEGFREHILTVAFTVVFSLCSAGFTTWLSVRDLKRDVAAHAQTLNEQTIQSREVQRQNQDLAIAVAKLNVLVEQLNKQLERLERISDTQ